MAKQRTTPIDIQAGLGAGHRGDKPMNLEESQYAAKQRAAQETQATGKAVKMCDHCGTPVVHDAKGLHVCAKCRTQLLPEVAARRAKEQAEQLAERKRNREAVMNEARAGGRRI